MCVCVCVCVCVFSGTHQRHPETTPAAVHLLLNIWLHRSHKASFNIACALLLGCSKEGFHFQSCTVTVTLTL